MVVDANAVVQVARDASNEALIAIRTKPSGGPSVLLLMDPAKARKIAAELLKAAMAIETEPCCECGEEYPRIDLIQNRQVYCKKCRMVPDGSV